MKYKYAPLTGANLKKSIKRRGKPLRYNLSSLRDLLVAKFLPDTNNFLYFAGIVCERIYIRRIREIREIRG